MAQARTTGIAVADRVKIAHGSADRRPVVFEAPDLDAQPEVEALLGSLGLGAFDRASLHSPFGRNDVWAGPTSVGRQLFVKRLRGSPDDVEARFARLHTFETVLAAQTGIPVDVPAHLGSDAASALVVYEFVPDGVTGAQHMVDETYDAGLARATGAGLGGIHTMSVPPDVELDISLPALPSLDLLNGLPLTMFESVSYGQLEAWRLQQNDPLLLDALVALAEREAAATRTPAHCDFRVDQLLVVDGKVVVTDWEEFRLADPARDVGSFTGEWLYRSILDIASTRGDAAPGAEVFSDSGMDHDAVLRRGVQKIERLRPLIEQFWLAYRSRRHVDAEFAERATAFAGWHLLDRLLAGSAFTGRTSGIERAAAGVGRGVLLAPDRFATVLGLEV